MIQIRKNYCPWLSKNTKKLIQRRNSAQKIASETQKTDDWKKFKEMRNNVNKTLKHEKMQNCSNDKGKTWKNIKGCLGWSSTPIIS